jgi:uncharacterized protein YjbI with pentapeptide repeats
MAARSKKGSAPKKPKPGAAKKLAGKTVGFVGKFGYSNMYRARYEKLAKAAGAKVVDPEQTAPDMLVQGEGRGGKPPALVAKIQTQSPQTAVVDEAGLCALLTPFPDELAAEMRCGKMDYHRWQELEHILGRSGSHLDLSGVNLSGVKLPDARLATLNLDRADFRKADLTDAEVSDNHTPVIQGAKFNEASLCGATICNAADCDFGGAQLREAWCYDAKLARCDFSEAKLVELNGDRSKFVDCRFRKADLSDAALEDCSFDNGDFRQANLSRVHAEKANFQGANLSQAVLFRADLRDVCLVNADLRKADLRQATLQGADLSGANVEGADFAGASLRGAVTTGVDFARARNYSAPVVRQAGAKLKELAAVAAGSKSFLTTARVQIDATEYGVLQLSASPSARFDYYRGDTSSSDGGWVKARTFGEGMMNLLDRFPGATLRLETITARGSQTLRGRKLVDLAVAAWAESAGIADVDKDKGAQEAERDSLKETMLAELRGGPAGIKRWNARPPGDFKHVGNFRAANLAGARMDRVEFKYCGGGFSIDFQRADFSGASLVKATFHYVRFQKTNFQNANLQGAKIEGHFQESCLTNANLQGAEIAGVEMGKANLTKADLRNATLSLVSLKGADLTGANLKGATFEEVDFDGDTRFPSGFAGADGLVWKGAGPNPFARKRAPVKVSASLDFDGFMERLHESIDAAKLSKALKMLKADRFQLFTELKDESLVGIVKSQTDKDLIYSCRLTAEGAFGCGTQNLKPCGGLQGSLCKHLLVLLVGLARAGALKPGQAATWIAASHQHKPTLDKDAISETFLRYKGAEAGEVDWRPTETIPEDYYAL